MHLAWVWHIIWPHASGILLVSIFSTVLGEFRFWSGSMLSTFTFTFSSCALDAPKWAKRRVSQKAHDCTVQTSTLRWISKQGKMYIQGYVGSNLTVKDLVSVLVQAVPQHLWQSASANPWAVCHDQIQHLQIQQRRRFSCVPWWAKMWSAVRAVQPTAVQYQGTVQQPAIQPFSRANTLELELANNTRLFKEIS